MSTTHHPQQTSPFWTHIGANIASNVVDCTNGVKRTEAIHPNRGILLPAQWMPIAASEVTGQLGYSEPADLMSDRAVGEVVIYRRDGYRNLMGIVGGHPLHHTRLDTPANVTSPAALEPVAKAMSRLIQRILSLPT